MYQEMGEVDDGPGGAGGAAEERDDDEPREEEDENVRDPDAGVGEPLGVPVEINRRHGLNVEVRHWRLKTASFLLFRRQLQAHVFIEERGSGSGLCKRLDHNGPRSETIGR